MTAILKEVPKRQTIPNDDIRIMVKMLRAARRGDITDIAMVARNRNGSVAHYVHAQINAPCMLGALEWTKSRLMSKWESSS